MEQAGTPVYNSKYQQQIDALLDQVAGRGSFNYDGAAIRCIRHTRTNTCRAGGWPCRTPWGRRRR